MSMQGLRPTLAAALLCLCAAAHGAELGLAEAVARALERHGAIREEQAAVSASRHDAVLAGLPPPVTVGLEFENVAGRGSVSGTQAAETTLRLGRVVELGGKREARATLAAAQVSRRENEVRRRMLDVAAAVTHRFVEVAATQARLDLAARSSALVEARRDAIAAAVRGGARPASDLDLAELERLRADLEREDAEHAFAVAKVALAVMWGERQPDFRRVAAKLEELPGTRSLEDFARQLPDSPDQHALGLAEEELDASRRVSAASARPDLQASVGVRQLEAFDEQALVFSLSLPLGTAGRAAHALNRHSAQADGLVARRMQLALDSWAELHGHFQELQHARREFETVTTQMIPRATAVLEAMQKGYEQSRYDFVPLSQASASLLALEQQAIAAAARFHHLLADIERATASTGALTP